MEDLGDAVDSLRFLVARPGTFEDTYPETTEDMLLQILMDGLGEAHLEGLLMDYESDADGLLTPELSSGQAATVVLFAAVRFMRAELFNRTTMNSYKAGSASYETTQATNILRDILKALDAQKLRVIATGAAAGAGAAFYMADQFLTRVNADWAPVTLVSGW
jgi:hypothetical protein